MIRALAYRKGQAATLALLAALVTACAVFAPFYDRVMQQALVDVKLTEAPALDTSLVIQERAVPVTDGPPPNVPGPRDLMAAVPSGLRHWFQEPSYGWTAEATVPHRPLNLSGQVMSRTEACEHVTIVSGRCPKAAGEILVSVADEKTFGYRPGQVVPTDVAAQAADEPARERGLVVVGSYREVRGSDYFAEPLTGWSGVTVADVSPAVIRHEIWLTDDATFADGPDALPDPRSVAVLRLAKDRVGIDEIGSLAAVAAVHESPVLNGRQTVPDVRTGLPDIAAEIASQVDDSRVLVPLILAPLATLCLVVLWLVLVTITDLRRSEVAVARLRGQGVRGARRLLAGELVPVVLLGAIPGLVAAVGGAWLAARLLPGEAGLELRVPVLVSLLGVLVVLVGATWAASSRVARTPVDELVRRSATFRRGWRMRALDAVLLTGCVVLAVEFVTGGLSGPASYVAPALFALGVGLVLAYLITPLAGAGGRALLRRRASGAALGLLDAARSQSLRSTVTVLTVATALTVFSVDAVLVAAHNRDLAARQAAGAPAVLQVVGADLGAVDAGIDRAVHETGDRRITPVVTIRPSGDPSITTLAVRPEDFARTALLAPGALPADWVDLLSPDDIEPVDLTGRRLTVSVSGGVLGTEEPAVLGVDVVTDSIVYHRDLGPLPASGGARLGVDVPCADTCHLSALTLTGSVGSSMSGSVTFDRVSVDGQPVSLGNASTWTAYDGDALTPGGTDALTLDVSTDGQEEVATTQAFFAGSVPVVATAGARPHSQDYSITGLDGRSRAADLAGRATRLPGAPALAVLANLDVLRRASHPDSQAVLSVWLGDADLVAPTRRALAAQGVALAGVSTLEGVRHDLDRSIPTWAVQLGVVTGLVSLLVALLMLALTAVSGWRVRARDLAALWVGGVPRGIVSRLAVLAPLPVIAVAVLGGAAAGLVGAIVATPSIPLFAEPPEVDTLDLATPWLPVLAVTAACLLLLGLLGAATGRAVYRRAALARLKEGV
ncbi:FtsX-like permease family protein [Nocardioides terrae]|uniref:FtsX-like permease family protein n=1 Tax=Nocardioides terrae TaxID=574651 RepID=A0A1I1DXL5_9ACTN|nr:FtsX-like permease family protein [Nocardioides terrae]SFB79564.1 FtsX-like permease family protein [Nocardioides terrae]